MKQTVRAPFATGQAEKLSKRLYRKQVLKFGEIDYKGKRTVNFDKKYAEDIIDAFRDSAFDTVPFVLADASNRHTRDPERARGEIVDLETTDTGLDAIISLSPSAAALVDENPKLGVSVSVREEYQRADGKYYDRALAHVLGTFEPVLTGMTPWQSVDASVDEEEDVLDLSTINLSGNPKEKEMPQKKYSEEEQEALFSRLEQFLASLESNDDTEDEEQEIEQQAAAETEDEEGDLTPEEIEEIRAYLAEYDAAVASAKETVDASQDEDDSRTIELSNALKAQENEIRKLRAENNRRAFESERDNWLRAGIPPVALDLARPLLTGKNVVELSDTGKEVDAGDIVRKVFEAIGKHGLVQMDEFGNNLDFSREDDEEELEARSSRIASIRKQMNI